MYVSRVVSLSTYLLFLNSLAPGKFEWNSRHVIFKQILVIDGWGISCEIALIWMSLDFTDDQSTLVQVMAWCRQATRHYLSQCWPRSLSPYGVTGPQWVKMDALKLAVHVLFLLVWFSACMYVPNSFISGWPRSWSMREDVTNVTSSHWLGPCSATYRKRSLLLHYNNVINHQPHHCLLRRLFGSRSKKTSKLRVTGLCAGNSPVTGHKIYLKMSSGKWRPFCLGLNVLSWYPLICICERSPKSLRHFLLDKMAAISTDDIFKCIFIS